MGSLVETTVERQVALLQMNRPEVRNALNEELITTVREQIAAADASDDADAIAVSYTHLTLPTN